MATTLITLPDFNFSGIYYPEILEDLTQYTRVNCPEITDEDEKEPFEQLKRAFSLVGHLSNVLLDGVAIEEFIATCQLRSSLASHLALIDVQLAQAKPASADLLLELSQVLTATTEVVPAKSQFATEETNDSPAIRMRTSPRSARPGRIRSPASWLMTRLPRATRATPRKRSPRPATSPPAGAPPWNRGTRSTSGTPTSCGTRRSWSSRPVLP
jgi:hypothetical protein